MPPTLSRALEIVVSVSTKGPRRPHWYDRPVETLIEHLGDVSVQEITPDDVFSWYDYIKSMDNQRKPGQKLSPWTVDSYARSVRSFFNKLVILGHLERSPAARLRLPRLPAKGKKEIDTKDIGLMVQYSEINPRDHAIVLMLRDSGCRVGELVSMRVSGVKFEEIGGRLRGRVIIYDQKTMASRFAYFGHDAACALKRYMRVRHHDAPDDLWLAHRGTPLTSSGVYQALKRIAKRAGVTRFNPHAFRHALAKRLINNNAPHKVVQDILGHRDIATTLNMYVAYDEDELADWHEKYNK